jgi:hypothetical protein
MMVVATLAITLLAKIAKKVMSQTHIHHVIPRSRGGADNSENLVELDFIEHAKLHADDFLKGGPMFDFRHPGWPYLETNLREKVLSLASELRRERNLAWEVHPALGCKHSEESKRARSEKLKGPKNPMFGTPNQNRLGIPHTEETKTHLSEKLRGNQNRSGKPWSNEEREHHLRERLGKMWWVNTQTAQTTKSKTCPGPEWIRGRKLLST